MSTKLFKAQCETGKVTLHGAQVTGAQILSAGHAASEGCLILCGPDAVYIAIPVNSIKQIISSVSDLTDKIMSGVLPSNAGGAITSATFVADLAQIKKQLENLKEAIQ